MILHVVANMQSRKALCKCTTNGVFVKPDHKLELIEVVPTDVRTCFGSVPGSE